jgi:hypothetical protein
MHGDKDGINAYGNMAETMKQWTSAIGTDQTADSTSSLKGHPYALYSNAVATVSVNGMSHGIAVDPGSGADQGGTTSTLSFAVNLWSTYYVAKFFGIAP